MHRRYPDTTKVLYQTTAPPKFVCQLTTRDGGRLGMYPIHLHSAFMDVHGEGATDVIASHFHRIRNGRVLPDPSDGHTHRLTGLPCGAG
jgi:hypothetical protein